jgi:hypothetical protein
MMMWRQRVAATKIDSPLMAVSGRHLRLEDGKVCDTDEGGWVINTFCNQFSRLAQMHTGGEKSISARDRVRDLRGMVGVACFTMNANSCHPTTHHPPQPAIRPHPFTDFNQLQLRQSFIEIVVPALPPKPRTDLGTLLGLCIDQRAPHVKFAEQQPRGTFAVAIVVIYTAARTALRAQWHRATCGPTDGDLTARIRQKCTQLRAYCVDESRTCTHCSA